MLVDGAFADTNGISNHFDRYRVFALVEKELERGIENFLLTAAKFSDFAGFYLHDSTAL